MQYILHTPLTKAALAPLKAGDTVLLSGVVYTARDAAHARMMELLDKGELLPFPIEGAAERWSLFDKRYTPCFRAEKLLVHGDASLRQSGLRVLIVTNGSGELEINGKYCKLSAYDRILIPAKTEEIRFHSEERLELIAARPPEV